MAATGEGNISRSTTFLLAAGLSTALPAMAAVQSGNNRAANPSQGASSPAAAEQNPAAERLRRCQEQAATNLGRLDSLGNTASSVTRSIGRFIGASENSVNRVLRFGSSISDSIARRLDCHEQEQAENATDRAIEGGVGTTSNWTSNSRQNVRGSSSVTTRQNGPDGRTCLTITDIVIVDGEETRAPKRMCRTPPSNAYVRV